MGMILKKIIQNLFRLFGLKISRYVHTPNAFVEHGVTLLLDIGANSGQFAKEIRKEGYKQRIVSFEPLSTAHQVLLQKSQSDSFWEIAPRSAIGSEPKNAEINVSNNSYSSSILEMLPAHLKSAPDSRYISREEITVVTLDTEFVKYMRKNDLIGIKIDTQGYEKEVLAGAVKVLLQTKVIQLELSVIPLYSGSEIYDYFFDFFSKNGFKLWGISPEFSNPETGQLLQFNAVFVKM
jgi:hypothetical protein